MSADPLQQHGSGTATPDSGASDWNWDAVDREIERLAAAPPRDAHNSSEEEEAEGAQLLADGPVPAGAAATSRLQDRLARRRLVLLVCAAVLSVGSCVPSSSPPSRSLAWADPCTHRHYSTYTLGPIKKSLGTTEGGFAALVSSFELLNTVTPLLSGFLVPRYGAAACGLVATGAVLVGQLIVCVSSSREGGIGNNVGGTVLGLLVFGSGTAPLAVVQESIILKHNSASSRFVARSVAAGLLLGKSVRRGALRRGPRMATDLPVPQASFAAGWSSQRLYTMSPRLPFITAASLSLFSFLACVLYACVERSTVRLRAHTSQVTESTSRKPIDPPEPEPADPSAHRPLHLSSLARFGDPFWWYLAVCVLAGSWYTTQHLSTHLVQATYGGISQADASGTASLLLGTPIVVRGLGPRCRWPGESVGLMLERT